MNTSKYIKIDRKQQAQALIIANINRLSAEAQQRIKSISTSKKSASTSLAPGSPKNLSVTSIDSVAACNSSTTGPLLLMDSSIQVRKLVSLSQGSEIKLLDANSNKVKGEQSFHGNTLGSGIVAEVIHAIEIGYQSDAANDQVANLVYDKDFDKFIRNSHFIIHQDNKQILRLPMTLFDPRNGAINVKDRFVELEMPIILIGGQALNFDFILETPSNTTVPTAFHYLEVTTRGIRA